MVVAHSSSASASGALMPPPKSVPIYRKNAPSKRKKTVLDEDEYTNALELIIERDFFPEISKATTFRQDDDEEDGSIQSAIKNDSSITLDKFVGKYTSEDNESFQELHENDLKERRKKLHWVYEPENKSEKAGMLMLYYMDGKKLSVEDRNRFEQNMEQYHREGDNRQNAPDTWQFRVRNQLFYPPELEVSEEICRVTQVDGTQT